MKELGQNNEGILMSDEKERVKECAIQILKKLNYDIDEIEPVVEASTYPEDVSFSVILNLFQLKFELKNPSHIENPEIKRRLTVLNRHLEECINRKQS